MLGHSRRVALYSVLIAVRMHAEVASVPALLLAGELHDVGNRAVPRRVLQSDRSLEDEDRELVTLHALEGERALASFGLASDGRWVRHHHERWDGGGYPDHLGGEQIPLESRIIAGAERLEALTSPRGYRSALGRRAAAVQLEAAADTLLDPRVSSAALELLEEGLAAAR